MKIPKSTWTVNKNYFEVTLVEDFKEKYVQWQLGYNGYELDELTTQGIVEVIDNWQHRSDSGVLELYQFPMEVNTQCYCSEIIEEDRDYFERLDDNWVIPRHLFVLCQ